MSHRFPGEITSHGVWLYDRFTLSYCDAQESPFERGIDGPYEAIVTWCRKFGQDYINNGAHQRGRGLQPPPHPSRRDATPRGPVAQPLRRGSPARDRLRKRWPGDHRGRA